MEETSLQLTGFNDITRTYRHIFLSPHFDDVVYACGGTLGVQVSCGLHPLVVTVFGGIPSSNLQLSPLGGAQMLRNPLNTSIPPSSLQLSPLAAQIHREMGAKAGEGIGSVIEKRRKEDAVALDYLQVDYLWLDYLDAIYRGTPAYYTTKDQLIGGEVNPADSWIDKQLAQDLLTLQERLPDTVWYAPLGIGRHVDHQLVCSAADRLVQRGVKVCFYEDFPYVLKEGAREARLNELGGAFEPALVEMSEMLPLRIEASDLYASQIEPNFGDATTMHRVMGQYTHGIRPVETVHLERYWTPR
jgi:LmbE family N-acetylglucosaminyl deacetylase